MYTILNNGEYRRNSDGAIIPNDMSNRDRQAVQKWLDEGNVPDVEAGPDPTVADGLARLDELDRKSARPLRAIVAGTAIQKDQEKLAQYEAEAAEIRANL